MKQNWLRKQVDEAQTEFLAWAKWEQEAYKAELERMRLRSAGHQIAENPPPKKPGD